MAGAIDGAIIGGMWGTADAYVHSQNMLMGGLTGALEGAAFGAIGGAAFGAAAHGLMKGERLLYAYLIRRGRRLYDPKIYVRSGGSYNPEFHRVGIEQGAKAARRAHLFLHEGVHSLFGDYKMARNVKAMMTHFSGNLFYAEEVAAYAAERAYLVLRRGGELTRFTREMQPYDQSIRRMVKAKYDIAARMRREYMIYKIGGGIGGAIGGAYLLERYL